MQKLLCYLFLGIFLMSSPVCCHCSAGWACQCRAAEPLHCCFPARIWCLVQPETSWGSGGSCTGSPTEFGSQGWGPLSSAAAHTANPAVQPQVYIKMYYDDSLFLCAEEDEPCQGCLWALWCPDLCVWAQETRQTREKNIFVVINSNVSVKGAA